MNVSRFSPLSLLTDFKSLLLVSTILRVGLILYSEWHDARSVVKYTDVDYRVFSDAARFVMNPGEGGFAKGWLGKWLGVGDPYTRATYRYTPLLAVLVTPNEWLHESFGKYLFAGCDIFAGVLIYRLLIGEILPRRDSYGSSEPVPKKPSPSLSNTPPISLSKSPSSPPSNPSPPSLTLTTQASLLTSLHLLNPLIFTISTRGSSESILSLFVLLTLTWALKGKWDWAAVGLGVATHWKIYPGVWGVGFLGVVGAGVGGRGGRGRGWEGLGAEVRRLVNWRTVRFGLLSAGTFFVLGGFCYAVWGEPFLQETYLYHLTRRDHRHNFSPYFYPIYLTYPSLHSLPSTLPSSLGLWKKVIRSPLTSFVPQMVFTLGAGLGLGRRREDLVFGMFVQTFGFVVFNKVCTSQYFLWYMIFLPLLIPHLSFSPLRGTFVVGVWVGVQAVWLAEAYKLEFLGENVFLGVWVRSLGYFLGSCWVLFEVMGAYRRGSVVSGWVG
ncbi:glycosyltransferase family 50 protein [Jaapia argillacea MUCL 33604]|uniref:GPI mannosyltransferase 1 n=1 Tax=Jaapia argillacea MUCL 33604 TaxID=933084 RepID=A0A067Q261_9AGAM|nr:glycosyltransferase family 50 protein [Jaapia argillacea MUCL 33604]